MTGEEFGTKFLSEIQGIEPFSPLAAAIRRVLGIDEPKSPPTEPRPEQTFVPPEFPQIRVKFDRSGNELARSRVVTSLDDLSLLSRENSEIFGWLPVPLVTAKE